MICTHTKRRLSLVLVEISFYLFITAPSAYKTSWLSYFLCSFLFTCAIFFSHFYSSKGVFFMNIQKSRLTYFLFPPMFFHWFVFVLSYCPTLNMINFAKLWNWTFLVLIAIPLKGRKKRRWKNYKRKDRKIKNGVCPSLLPEYHSGKGVKKKTRREKLCGGLEKK